MSRDGHQEKHFLFWNSLAQNLHIFGLKKTSNKMKDMRKRRAVLRRKFHTLTMISSPQKAKKAMFLKFRRIFSDKALVRT